jgi:hypothetical protein
LPWSQFSQVENFKIYGKSTDINNLFTLKKLVSFVSKFDKKWPLGTNVINVYANKFTAKGIIISFDFTHNFENFLHKTILNPTKLYEKTVVDNIGP